MAFWSVRLCRRTVLKFNWCCRWTSGCGGRRRSVQAVPGPETLTGLLASSREATTTSDVPAIGWHDAVARGVHSPVAGSSDGHRRDREALARDPDIIVVCRLGNHDGDDVTISTHYCLNDGGTDCCRRAGRGHPGINRRSTFWCEFVGPGADDRALLVPCETAPAHARSYVGAAADTVWPEGAADQAGSRSASLPVGVP